MDPGAKTAILGSVRSLHLHPEQPGGPMRQVRTFEAVAELGIRGDDRNYSRRSRSTGQPSVRQVSLMEREQIAEHAQAVGLPQIAPGAVRANVETEGLNLVAMIGRHLRVGDAIVRVCEARTPCAKMDAICQGLRARMQENRQGVLGQVVQSGTISEGDSISLLDEGA
jgi:MOSC domain-containing protein YiiM